MDEKIEKEKDGVYELNKEMGGVMYAAPKINMT